MADRFVQEDAWPAGPEHDFHRPGRRINGAELQDRLAGTFAGQFLRIQFTCKDIEGAAAAATLITRLPLAGFLGDAHHIESYERLEIPGTPSIRCGDENVLCLVDVADLDLFDPRIVSTRSLICLLEQPDFFGDLKVGGNYRHRIEPSILGNRIRDSDTSALRRRTCNKRCGPGSLDNVLAIQVV